MPDFYFTLEQILEAIDEKLIDEANIERGATKDNGELFDGRDEIRLTTRNGGKLTGFKNFRAWTYQQAEAEESCKDPINLEGRSIYRWLYERVIDRTILVRYRFNPALPRDFDIKKRHRPSLDRISKMTIRYREPWPEFVQKVQLNLIDHISSLAQTS